jgi:hypothetical protein
MTFYTTTKFCCTPTVKLAKTEDGAYRIPGKPGLIVAEGKRWRIEVRAIKWGGYTTLRDAAAMLADIVAND